MDENLALGVYVACVLVFLTLNLSRSLMVIWCMFRKKGANSKTAHCRVKRMKIWGVCSMPLFLPLFIVIWGHLMYFSEKGG